MIISKHPHLKELSGDVFIWFVQYLNMDAKAQAELRVLIAADNWAREVMRRRDKHLDPPEQKLMDAVMEYLRLRRILNEKPVVIPRPPNIPRFTDTETPTARYSTVQTVPSPPQGIPAVKKI